MEYSDSVNEIIHEININAFKKQYKDLDTQGDILKYKLMLKGSITIISLENKTKIKIKKAYINEEF